MHAGEMQDALTRGNLTTARRHAEHLINLAEGKQGPDYGDADGDGVVEDPGDGTGALVYLERVLAAPGQPASNRDQAVQIAGEVRGRMLKIVEDARAVIQASDLQSAAGSIREAVDLSQQIKNGSTGNVAQLLEALNQSASPSTVVETTSPSGGQAVVVNMKDFAFDPKLLKVKAGTTVIFVNQDPEKHTVTSDTGLFDSGDILPGKSFSYTFLQAGTFPYFCVFHGDKGGVDMAGSVVVDP
jgi:plastocyanin